MAYELVETQQGMSGLAGMFGPDALIATGKADTLGSTKNMTSRAKMVEMLGAPGGPIFDVCQRSMDPVTCAGQHLTAKPFLGRPFQNEWRVWVAQQLAGGAGGGAAPVNYAPAIQEDNTMLYAGAALVGLVAIGAVVVATRKKR